MIRNQVITNNYALYESDCMYVMPSLKDESIDFSVYSPPFAGLYNYSSHENDFSNCETREQFLEQYDFLIAEIARVTKAGRITAVHITDIMGKDGELWDFPKHVKELHRKHGFKHRNTITIWKEPLKVRLRTMVKSLMHKLVVEDATEVFTSMPDYILIFKKEGQNAIPVQHPFGLTHYAGEMPLLPDHLDTYGLPISEFPIQGNFGEWFYAYSQESFKALQRKYAGFDGDHKENKLSHIVWQRYASSVWDDIRIDNVLPFKDSRDEDDEKHVHPLQLDVIDRLVELYTNEGEVVLTPFMGVGSEVFSPVSMGRKAVGIELKDSYFKQAVLNCEEAEKRFAESQAQLQLF